MSKELEKVVTEKMTFTAPVVFNPNLPSSPGTVVGCPQSFNSTTVFGM
jgi:hypothetical protein